MFKPSNVQIYTRIKNCQHINRSKIWIMQAKINIITAKSALMRRTAKYICVNKNKMRTYYRIKDKSISDKISK
jgi:hypothetical protein